MASRKQYTWTKVTDTFSEEERYYKDTYLEKDEVYDMQVEVSLFSRPDGPYEIYVSYGLMHGIIYVEAAKATDICEAIKADIEKVYDGSANPPEGFIDTFAKKYDIQLPSDIFFDFDIENLF